MSLLQYPSLIDDIGLILTQARITVSSQINHTMVMTYRTIGHHIVEYEQGGSDKSQYGSALLQQLSDDLTKRFGRGFSRQNIQNMKQFYITFPNSQTLSSKSYLSWSHYIMLMRMNEPERMFYEIECQENNRSLRELKRQFDSGLYLRLALNKDKKGIQKLSIQGHTITKAQDIVKDPYVLEFLGIQADKSYSESELEQAIIDKLEHFLLELGKGFTFVSRQERLSFDEKHFFVDLVFYNRLLQCFVIIDLKIGEIKHQDLGQMQMYVNYYDRYIRQDFENPTIGILLCRDKNDTLVEITLPPNSNIFASKYQLYLPNKQELKNIIEQTTDNEY